MAILSKGTTYSDGDQVTSTNLNALVDSATFASGAVDDSTTQLSTGKIIVKDLGIATGKIAASAVTTAKIADSNVTKAKIENVANLKVLGNVSGSAAAPAEVAILDEDNMASNSATSLATQQSIKAYADSKVDGTGAGSFTTLAASGDVTFDTTTLKVDSSNNRVGIGTASPTQPLDVNGQARIVGNLFVGTDDTTPNGMIEVYGGGTGQNEGGEIRLRTAADFDTTYNHYFIDAYEDDLRIGRAGGADFILNSSGNVGIGTNFDSSTIAADFHIRNTGDASIIIEADTGNTVGDEQFNPSLVFKQDGASVTAAAGMVGDAGQIYTNSLENSTYLGSTAAYPLQLFTNNAARMTFDTSGNVGLGTHTPSCLLDINDDAATGVGIRVTGGGSAGPLARFIRDVDVTASLEINAGGGDPQLKFTSSGSDVMAIGLDGSENTFQVCAGSSVGSNQVLVVGINGNVGIGETVPSAPLTVTSTTGGVLMPRMTTTQMNAISSPANGEMIYNTTANKFYGYASGAWVALH